MKVVFLCNNFKSLNGVERVWSQRLSLLAEHPDYEVYLITYNQYGAPLSFPTYPIKSTILIWALVISLVVLFMASINI